MTAQSDRTIDTGTAYGLAPRAYKQNLVEVGPGTPMGELLRRYWQPCALSERLTDDKPQRVRLLGEDLILFRDGQGRPGLVHEQCCHRGTSLFYGRIEDDGIRCCYHGWKFDAQGNCLDQPAEVDGGRNRARVRQPWYPVEERYGLVYAYLGPPEKKPVLPRWSQFEDMGPDEIIETRERPPYGPEDRDGYPFSAFGFNWLQAYENTMDAPHLPWLHYYHSGDQFTRLKLAETELPPYARIKDLAGAMLIEHTPLGVKQGCPMPGPNGIQILSCNEAVLPNVAVIPGFIDLLYVVPMDDTHFYTVPLWRSKFKGERSGNMELHDGKSWSEMTAEEHRRSPGDYEAQSSIGVLPAHNHEHLSQGDRAIGMLRRRLEEMVQAVAEGRDPSGISFDPDAPPIVSRAHGMRPLENAA